MALNLDALLIHIIINVILLSPVLWLAGRALAGKQRAKFTDALWIVVVGTVVGTILGGLFSGLIAAVIQLIVWLLIVKHFFDCGWLKALAISILTVIFFIVIAIVLGLIGFALIKIL